MPQSYIVKGVTPLGRIVEFTVLVETERQAKEKAIDLGLISCTVRPAAPPAPPLGEGPTGGEQAPPG